MSQTQFAVVVIVIQITSRLFSCTQGLRSGAKPVLAFALLAFRKHYTANCYFMDVAKAVFIYARFTGCVMLTNFHN